MVRRRRRRGGGCGGGDVGHGGGIGRHGFNLVLGRTIGDWSCLLLVVPVVEGILRAYLSRWLCCQYM